MVKRRRTWTWPRVLLLVGIYLLLLLGIFLPHLGIAGLGRGRSLIPAGHFLSQVPIDSIGHGFDVWTLGFGVTVGYLGIGLHELGLLLALPAVWALAPEEINRWLYRMAAIGGWLLLLSGPTVVFGWQLIRDSGAPGLLGWAWLPTFCAGLAVVITTRQARKRIDDTWYVTRPELQ